MRFAVGGFTNFGMDHLDFHTDVEDYFAAKARLFDGRCRTEIAQPRRPGRAAAGQADDGDLLGGRRPGATWRATDVTPDGFAQHFTAHGPDGLAVAAGVALPGRHNVANALLAIAALVAVGVDPAIAAAGVAACPGVPGRLERVGRARRGRSAWSTTRTSPTRSSRCSPRCARWPPTGVAG